MSLSRSQTWCDPSAFTRRLAEHRTIVERAALQRVAMFGAMVVSQAAILAPVEFGDLKASGFYDAPEINGMVITQRLGFATAYAAVQHENLSFHHPQGGQAKFLEIPLRTLAPKFNEFVAAGIPK